ncbi:MAG TPA: SgcJ/EcaC family oxidoreductase [Silvibacterium sp.]|jgi:uncharacterized protein (TIGR02246 family)|nr:SgcJ/EcaC family oxidoreductase [Silvibacterium sp.]
MRKFPVSVCALLLFLSLAACKDKAPDRTADAQAIRDNEAAWVKDWQAKDADKITSHYAPDAVLLVTNMPIMKGSDAIKSGIGTMLKDPHLSLTFSPTLVVVAKGDDIAYTQGVYTMTYSEPKTGMTLIEKGKYVTVYKKQDDGTWKAVEDIDNADAPATQAPAETPAAKT